MNYTLLTVPLASGITFHLFFEALACFLLAWWIGSRFLSLPVASAIAFLRTAVPFVYFAWFFNGTWTIIDDQSYYQYGKQMLEQGYNPLNALTSLQGLNTLGSLANGRHFLYIWWNVLAQYLFGKEYYAAVFLNVVLTFACAYLLFLLAKDCGFTKSYAGAFSVYFLFQWDVLAWSSFLNVKDTMVLLLTVLCMKGLVRFNKTRRTSSLLLAIASGFSLLFARLYDPILILAAWAISIFLFTKGVKKYFWVPIAVGCAVFLFYFLGLEYDIKQIGYADVYTGVVHTGAGGIHLKEMALNAFKFLLAPKPWDIVQSDSFLVIPSILHWLFLALALPQGFALWKKSKEIRLLLIYFLVVCLFYGNFYFYFMMPGPRDRYQLVFILSWMQFDFLWLMGKRLTQNILARATAAFSPAL